MRTAEESDEADLLEVCAKIAAKEKGVYLEDTFDDKQEKELAANYEESRRTELFKVNDACVGCGVCAGQCPVGAIELAYTDETIGHGQYTNPHVTAIE